MTSSVSDGRGKDSNVDSRVVVVSKVVVAILNCCNQNLSDLIASASNDLGIVY